MAKRTSVYSIIVLLFYFSNVVVQHFILYYDYFFFCNLDYITFPVKSEYVHIVLESFEANCMMYDGTFRKEIHKADVESLNYIRNRC